MRSETNQISLLTPNGVYATIAEPPQICSDVAVVILSAGMLDCSGPYRLHVDLADLIRSHGYLCLRIDQSGRGNSLARPGMSHAQSVHADYTDVINALQRYGIEQTVLIGLCSGADDAQRLFDAHESVVGTVMLDGLAEKTARYHFHHYARRLMRLRSWTGLVERLRQRPSHVAYDDLNLRDLNDDLNMPKACDRFLDRGGHLLAVFTNSASAYYNYQGQFASSLNSTAATRRLTEVYLREAQHLYPTTSQRKRLLTIIERWLLHAFTPQPANTNV